MSRPVRRGRTPPRPVSSPTWRRSVCGVDVAALQHAGRRAGSSEAKRLEDRDSGPRGRALRRQLDTAAARGPLRQARPGTPQKRTKTGFSTDAQTLEKLRGEHPIIDVPAAVPGGGEAPLDLRRVAPRRGGRRRPDPRDLQPDGGPHRPPELGPAQPPQHPGALRRGPIRFRKLLRAERRVCRFLVADYNQIELRVIAHLAEDPGLVGAFTSGGGHPHHHGGAHLRGRTRPT